MKYKKKYITLCNIQSNKSIYNKVGGSNPLSQLDSIDFSECNNKLYLPMEYIIDNLPQRAIETNLSQYQKDLIKYNIPIKNEITFDEYDLLESRFKNLYTAEIYVDNGYDKLIYKKKSNHIELEKELIKDLKRLDNLIQNMPVNTSIEFQDYNKLSRSNQKLFKLVRVSDGDGREDHMEYRKQPTEADNKQNEQKIAVLIQKAREMSSGTRISKKEFDLLPLLIQLELFDVFKEYDREEEELVNVYVKKFSPAEIKAFQERRAAEQSRFEMIAREMSSGTRISKTQYYLLPPEIRDELFDVFNEYDKDKEEWVKVYKKNFSPAEIKEFQERRAVEQEQNDTKARLMKSGTPIQQTAYNLLSREVKVLFRAEMDEDGDIYRYSKI